MIAEIYLLNVFYFGHCAEKLLCCKCYLHFAQNNKAIVKQHWRWRSRQATRSLVLGDDVLVCDIARKDARTVRA